MTKKNKILIISGGVLLVSAISYYIYQVIRINNINKRVVPFDDFVKEMQELKEKNEKSSPQVTLGIGSDTLENEVHPINPSESNLAIYNNNEEEALFINSNWDGASGYEYLFNDGTIDFYTSDDIFFASSNIYSNEIYFPE